MDAIDITEAELLQAIEEATGATAEIVGRTTGEWAMLWGCSFAKADKLLLQAHKAGLLEPVKVKRVNRVNVLSTVNAYKFKPRA